MTEHDIKWRDIQTRFSYQFLVTADDSLNELCPLEVLHGSHMREYEIEACQQRILDLPFAQRYAKVLTLWRMLEAVEADRPVKQSDAVAEAMALARKWEAKGVIVTIERVSNQEPAMGNHHPVVRAWAKRSKEPK